MDKLNVETIQDRLQVKRRLCKKYEVVLFYCTKSRCYSKIMIVTVLEDDDEGDADIIRVLRKI